MRKIKLVIPFKELLPEGGELELPSVQDHLYVLDAQIASTVANYLWNGLCEFEFMDPFFIDPVDEVTVIRTASFCDADYAWSSSLAYIVENYRTDLPEEFVRHIISQKKLPNEHLNWKDFGIRERFPSKEEISNTLRL